MNSSFFFIRVNPSLELLRLDLKLTSIVKSAPRDIYNVKLLFIMENDFHRLPSVRTPISAYIQPRFQLGRIRI